MIHHIGFEVSHLGRSSAFYDAVFQALGSRRLVDAFELTTGADRGTTVAVTMWRRR